MPSAPPATPCPGENALRRFAVGLLPEAVAVDVGSHLGACPDCAAACDEIFWPVLDGLRAASVADPTPDPDAGLLADLLPRLKQGVNRSHDGGPAFTPPPADTPDADAGRSVARPPATGDRIDTFRLGRVLGEGGMGMVFAAHDAALNREVAVKVIRDRSGGGGNAVQRDRFVREAQAAAALHNDHIIPVYQVGEAGGTVFLVMPLLPGESLADRLRRDRRPPVADVLRFGRQIADGLSAAHEHPRRFVHRDIKPSNVWLEDVGGVPRVRILDFGLAKPADGSDDMTAAGGVLGTPGYMPPEQIDGEVVDPRADLFSLGVVLYEMATGVKPFPGRDVAEKHEATTGTDPRPPSALATDLPAGLSDLVMGLLVKDAAARVPATARELFEALRELEREPVVVGGRGSSDGRSTIDLTSPAPKARGKKPRRRLWVDLAGLFAAAVAIAVACQVVIRIKQEGKADTEHTVPHGAKTVVDEKGNLTVTLPPVPKDSPKPPVKSEPGPLPVPPAGPTLDHFRQTDIPAAQLATAGGGRLDQTPPELVALVGDLVGTKTATPGGGHVGRVNRLAVHRNGKTLITAGSDATVRLWDLSAAVPKEVAVLDTHKSPVASLALSRDGFSLASGDEGGTVHVWDLPSRRVTRTVAVEKYAAAVDISPDGKLLAVADVTKVVKVFDLSKTDKRVVEPRAIDVSTQPVLAVRFLDGGARLACGGRSRWKVVDLRSNAEDTHQLEDKVNFATLSAWADADNHWLATNGGQAPTRVQAGLAPVFPSMGFYADPNQFAVRDAANGFSVQRSLKHDGRVIASAFSPDGLLLATTTDTTRLTVWRWEAKRELDRKVCEIVNLAVLPGTTAAFLDVAFHPDGRHVIAATQVGTAMVFRLPAAK